MQLRRVHLGCCWVYVKNSKDRARARPWIVQILSLFDRPQLSLNGRPLIALVLHESRGIGLGHGEWKVASGGELPRFVLEDLPGLLKSLSAARAVKVNMNKRRKIRGEIDMVDKH